MNRKLTLVTISDVKYPIELNESVLKQHGFTDFDDFNKFKIGDLRCFIFENWNSIFDAVMEKPEFIQQIQLFHSGKRLDPNTNLTNLNLDMLPFFHIFIKNKSDIDLAHNDDHSSYILSSSFKSMKNNLSLTNKNDKTNKPVPEFNKGIGKNGDPANNNTVYSPAGGTDENLGETESKLAPVTTATVPVIRPDPTCCCTIM